MKALYPLIAPLGSGSTIPNEHATPEYPFPSISPPQFLTGSGCVLSHRGLTSLWLWAVHTQQKSVQGAVIQACV